MATQESRNTESREQSDEVEVPEPAPLPAGGGAQTQTEGVDDLLDEIDGVLEQNAEEFVRGFVQKGGQ